MNLADLTDENIVYHHTGVQLWEHLKGRISGALADGATRRNQILSPEDLVSHGRALRTFLVDQFGGWPAGDSGTPSSTIAGEVSGEGFSIQNLILETRPKVFATANLYLPTQGKEPLPAVLFLCGHSAEGKAYDRYQSVCQRLVARGLAVLALDPTGQGERLNYFDPKCGKPKIRPATGDHEYCGLQCLLLGQNLSRYMLHDAIRAVDYLVAHPRIDAERIGITGNSGGGTQTALMMAVEPRLAAAAPGTFLTTRQAIFDTGIPQDSEQIWPGFTGAGYDHVDLVAAFAPKPVCILAVTEDFFPIEGTRALVAEAQRFWEMHQVPDVFRVVEDRNLHGFTDPLARAAADFFARVFGTHGPEAEAVPEPLPHSEVTCTRSGQVTGDDPEARTIYRENIAEWNRLRAGGIRIDAAKKFLREAVDCNRQVVPANLRVIKDLLVEGLRCRGGFWWSQEGLINSGFLIESDEKTSSSRPVTVALWEDGTSALAAHADWIRNQTLTGRAVLVLNTSGTGPIAPQPINTMAEATAVYGSLNRFADDLTTLDDSLAALRTFDVLRAVEGLEEWGGLDPGAEVHIYADGPYGIYGVFAAILERNLKLLPMENSPPRFEELIESEFYDDRSVKSLIIPGLIVHADWKDMI